MASLPAELCLHIFSFLDLRSLCLTAKVCRLFRYLALDPCLFREISLGPLGAKVAALACRQTIARFAPTLSSLQISSSGVEAHSLLFLAQAEQLRILRLSQVPAGLPTAMFSRLARLESLSMMGCPDLNDGNLVALSAVSKGLRSLELGGFRVSPECLGPAFANLGGLTSLRLESTELSREALVTHLPRLGQLRALSLRQTPSLSALPPTFWKNFPALTDLDLNRCTDLVPNDLILLGDDLPQLTRLDLGFAVNAVTNQVLGVLAERLTALQSLNLTGCTKFDNLPYSGEGGGSSPPFPSLRVLILTSCTNVGPGFFSSLSLCETLQELDLAYDKVQDEWMTLLFARGPHQQLQVLNLSYTQVTSGTLGILSAMAPALRHLMLCFCKVDESGVTSLAFGCQSLEVLNLKGCAQVTDECLFPLFQGLPNLRDLVNHGTKIKNSSISKLKGQGSRAPFFA